MNDSLIMDLKATFLAKFTFEAEMEINFKINIFGRKILNCTILLINSQLFYTIS